MAKLELRAGDRPRALVELDAATRIDPANPEILRALAELARDDGQLERAERSFRALLVVLRKDAGIARSEVFLELAAIARRQDDEGRAGELLESAFEAAARSTSEAFALERALRASGRFDMLARRYASVLQALATSELAGSDVWLRLGSVLESDLGDDRGAAETYEAALTRGVSTADVLRRLDRAYERLGDRAAQARVLERRVEVARRDHDRAGAAHALFRLAALRFADAATAREGCALLADAVEASGDWDRAEQAMRVAVATSPDDPEVLALYERVGREEGHERALLDALTRRLAREPRAAVLREAVTLAQTLAEPPAAEALLRDYLSRGAASERDDDRAWACDALAELRLSAGDAAEGVALKRRAADLAEPGQARDLSFEVARLAATTLGDLHLAAETYEVLLAREAADREAWEPLLDVYRRMPDPEKLARLLGVVVDYVDDPAERARLRLERVRVMMHDLGMGDAAADPLRDLVDEDPAQVDAALMLAGILERRGDERGLIDLLSRQLDSAKDRSDTRSIASFALRLGGLMAREDQVGARNVFIGALEWEPQNRELLRALLDALGSDADASDRADAMEKLLGLVEGEEAERLGLALAALRTETWDEEGAERALRLGLAAHPSSRALRERLEATYRERGAWPELAEIVTRALDSLDPGDAARGALLAQRAELRSKTGADEGALRDLEEAFALGAASATALVERLEHARARASEPAATRAVTLRLAALYPEVGRTDEARALLGEQVRVDGKDREALRALARLEEDAGAWDAASATWRRLVALEEGPAVVETALRLADACARAERPGDARGGLERARLVAPDDEALRGRLEKGDAATGAHRELAEMLLEEAKAARDVAGRFAALVRAGATLLEKAQDATSATIALREAHALRPADLDCAALLADALHASSRNAEAFELLSATVASHKGRRSKELAPLYHRLARVARASGERAGELAWLSTALDMDAQNGVIAFELASVAQELGQLEVAQRALRAITMLRGQAPVSRAVAYQRLGEIARMQGDAKRAVLLLRRAVDDDPHLESAKALLAKLEAEA